MKTLHFCNLVPGKKGAVELAMAEVTRQASLFGDKIIAVVAGEPCEEVQKLWRSAGLNWEIIPGWTDADGVEHPWAFPTRALDILKKHKPDVAVVHFGNELPAVVTVLLSRLSGLGRLKWVWIQDQQVCDPSPLARVVSRLRFLSRVFDRMVAVYEGGRVSMLRRGILPGKISVIYNSVADHAPPGLTRTIRDELGIPADSTVFFSASSLIQRKRIDFLVNALFRARQDTGADLRLVVAGDGSERTRLAEKCREKSLEGKVYFPGLRNDVRNIMCEADIYVHASIAETCTYAVTEAMCAGRPVVMTDAGAAREQVEDGVTGFVVGRDDMDSFVVRVRELIESPEKRDKMGKAGRERWSRMFRLEDAARKYVEMYRKMAGSGQ